MISEIADHIITIKIKVDKMIEARKKANEILDVKKRAIVNCEKVKSYFDLILYHVDKLELIIDDESGLLSKHTVLLFTKQLQ